MRPREMRRSDAVRPQVLPYAGDVVVPVIAWAAITTSLRDLSATRAGIVQLAVPVVAAAGGALILGEHVTSRLALASCAILGGIAIATSRPKS